MNFEFQVSATTKQDIPTGRIVIATYFGLSTSGCLSHLTIRRETTLYSATHRIPVDFTSTAVCTALALISELAIHGDPTSAAIEFVKLATDVSDTVERFIQDSAGRRKVFLQSTDQYRGEPFRVLVDVERQESTPSNIRRG